MPVLSWVHPHPAQTQKHGMKSLLLHSDLCREGLIASPAVHHWKCSPLYSAIDSEQSCIGAACHGALLCRLGFPNLDQGRVLRSPHACGCLQDTVDWRLGLLDGRELSLQPLCTHRRSGECQGKHTPGEFLSSVTLLRQRWNRCAQSAHMLARKIPLLTLFVLIKVVRGFIPLHRCLASFLCQPPTCFHSLLCWPDSSTQWGALSASSRRLHQHSAEHHDCYIFHRAPSCKGRCLASCKYLTQPPLVLSGHVTLGQLAGGLSAAAHCHAEPTQCDLARLLRYRFQFTPPAAAVIFMKTMDSLTSELVGLQAGVLGTGPELAALPPPVPACT